MDNRFSKSKNEDLETHLPRHRDSKIKKPRQLNSQTKKLQHRESETAKPQHRDSKAFFQRMKSHNIEIRRLKNQGIDIPSPKAMTLSFCEILIPTPLDMIPSCDWLWVVADSSSGGSIRVTADSIRLSANFNISNNISNNFKDLFRKVHHFYGLFSTALFQLPLIQAFPAASRTLKKLDEAWGNLKKLQDSSCDDFSCSVWFEPRW